MSSKPSFTPEQIAESFRRVCKGDIMEPHHVEPFMKDIGYDRAPEQLEEYRNLTKEIFGGKIPLEVVTLYMLEINDTERLMRAYVTSCDANGDGFIFEDEFKVCLKTLIAHDPTFPKVNFQDFVEEADTNRDGKISIDEAVDWVNKTIKNKKA